MNCENIKELLLDYINNTLDKDRKVLVENHLNKCNHCKYEFYKLKQTDSYLKKSCNKICIPKNLIDNIKINDKSLLSKRKKVNLKVVLIACIISILSLFTVMASENSLSRLLKSITKVESLKHNIDVGCGDKINVSNIDKNIKVTIVNAIADDFNTVLFYKVEDLSGKNKYTISACRQSFQAHSKWKNFSEYDYNHILPSAQFALYNEKNNIALGKVQLPAIDSSSNYIKFKIKKLTNFKDKKDIVGNWNFKFKVNKYPIKTYSINKEINIQGYDVKFTDIKIAPTKTLLEYEFKDFKNTKKFCGLNRVYLTCKNKKFKQTLFDTGLCSSGKDISFQSMYFINPNKITINIKSYSIEIFDKCDFVIDLKKSFPQKFKYLGSTITVDNINYKNDNLFMNINHDLDNRQYELLPFQCYLLDKKYEKYLMGTCISYNGIFMDRKRNKYSQEDGLSKIIDEPDTDLLFYATNSKVECIISNKEAKKPIKNIWQLKPRIKLSIKSYIKTEFTDKKLNVYLK